MKEIWADIKGYEGLYQISTWGNVRNIKGDLIFQERNKKGYLRVRLYKDGIRKNHRVSRLVAEAFISNPAELPQVNHIDGNKDNNSFTNLEWVDNTQNRAHAELMRKGILPTYIRGINV